MIKKKILSTLVIILVLCLTGCVNEKKVLKTELDKRYDNYEIIESTRYWNTGGDDDVQGIIKINNNFYKVLVDMSGEQNKYYESLIKEIDYNVKINDKIYSSTDNLILMEVSYLEDGIKETSKLLLFLENESSLNFYDSLYQLLKQLNDEYKSENDYPMLEMFFTDNINYNKKDDYKLFLALNLLSWNDNERTRKLSKELNVNNHFDFYSYTDDNAERLEFLKREIQYLKESYEAGMLYDDYVYEIGL